MSSLYWMLQMPELLLLLLLLVSAAEDYSASFCRLLCPLILLYLLIHQEIP